MATEIGFEIRRPTHAAGADDNWQPIMPPAAVHCRTSLDTSERLELTLGIFMSIGRR